MQAHYSPTIPDVMLVIQDAPLLDMDFDPSEPGMSVTSDIYEYWDATDVAEQ